MRERPLQDEQDNQGRIPKDCPKMYHMIHTYTAIRWAPLSFKRLAHLYRIVKRASMIEDHINERLMAWLSTQPFSNIELALLYGLCGPHPGRKYPLERENERNEKGKLIK